MAVFASVCLRKLFFALQVLLPLRRCPFFLNDFFGSHAPRVFPSSLSHPSEGQDGGGRSHDALLSLFLQKGGMEVGGLGMLLCCFPRVFLSSSSTWSSGRGGGAFGRAFGARELASVSSVHSWTGDPGVALLRKLRRTPATFSVPVGSPSSSLHARRGDGAGESSGRFLCSRLPLPPHLCTLSEVVKRMRLPSAAPVRVPPWPPDLRLGRPGGYLSPLLVGWLSCSILLLTLSLRLSCSVRRSRRCGSGSSRWLFSLVRSQCDRWRSTDR